MGYPTWVAGVVSLTCVIFLSFSPEPASAKALSIPIMAQQQQPQPNILNMNDMFAADNPMMGMGGGMGGGMMSGGTDGVKVPPGPAGQALYKIAEQAANNALVAAKKAGANSKTRKALKKAIIEQIISDAYLPKNAPRPQATILMLEEKKKKKGKGDDDDDDDDY